jgi:hypothetical protein
VGAKFKERHRWRLSSTFQTGNPFGNDLANLDRGIEPLVSGPYAFTAASAEAPFVDLDVVEVFLLSNRSDSSLRKQGPSQNSVPSLRFVTPYDVGVFMYTRRVRKIPIVSDAQAYLDLHARLKQADYLLPELS